MFWRAAKMVIPCEPQIRYMLCEPQTQLMWLRRWKLMYEKINRAAGFAARVFLFFLQSCTPCVLSSISALAPFSGGSSNELVRFQRFSSPARVAVFTGMIPSSPP